MRLPTLIISHRLFLSEGMVTVVVGVAIWFLLPDCEFPMPFCTVCLRNKWLISLLVPETARWLTDREKAFIQARLPANSPRSNEKDFNWREIIESLKDRRLWLFTAIWAIYTVATSGVRFYQATVIANLGFTYVSHYLTNYKCSIRLY